MYSVLNACSWIDCRELFLRKIAHGFWNNILCKNHATFKLVNEWKILCRDGVNSAHILTRGFMQIEHEAWCSTRNSGLGQAEVSHFNPHAFGCTK